MRSTQISKRKIKVREVDFTEENKFAEVDPNTNIIEIHYTLKGRTRMRKMIHELVHIVFPDANESQVKEAEKIIGNELWKQGYRWTDLKHK